VFLKDYGVVKFKRHAEHVFRFIDQTRKYLRRPQTNALLCTCFECLAEDLTRRNVPATPRTMLDQIERVEVAVDMNYPGYASAGMLHRIALLNFHT
jgi:hypothetical protein